MTRYLWPLLLVACSGEVAQTRDPASLAHLFCDAVNECPSESPVVQNGYVVLARYRRTWSECREAMGQHVDTLTTEQRAGLVETLESDQCMWSNPEGLGF